MTIIVRGMLDARLVTRGYVGGSSPPPSITVYPDPFAATSSVAGTGPDPMAATSSATIDPLAATSRLLGW